MKKVEKKRFFGHKWQAFSCLLAKLYFLVGFFGRLLIFDASLKKVEKKRFLAINGKAIALLFDANEWIKVDKKRFLAINGKPIALLFWLKLVVFRILLICDAG